MTEGSYSKIMFSFVRNYHFAFPLGTNSVSVAPHLHQQFVLSVVSNSDDKSWVN